MPSAPYPVPLVPPCPVPLVPPSPMPHTQCPWCPQTLCHAQCPWHPHAQRPTPSTPYPVPLAPPCPAPSCPPPHTRPETAGHPALQFVKVPSGVAPSVLFDLLLAEWQLPVPNLVVSLAGEERPFAMRSWLRDVLRKGLVKAAQSTGEAPPGPHGPHSPEPMPRPHSPQTLPGASLPAACSGSSLGDAAGGGRRGPGSPPREAQPTLRASARRPPLHPCPRAGPHRTLRLPQGSRLLDGRGVRTQLLG